MPNGDDGGRGRTKNWPVYAGFAVALAAASWAILHWYPMCVGGNCRTIIPSKIFSHGGAFPIDAFGSFRTQYAYYNAIESDRSGGGCLTADLVDLGYPRPGTYPKVCTKNADCADPVGGPAVKLPAGWGGYCDTDAGRCWTRPGSGFDGALCNKTPMWSPPKYWTENEDNPVGKDKPYPLGSLSFVAGGKSVKFRLIACLNGINAGDPPCSHLDDDNRIEVFGPESKPIPIPPAPPPHVVVADPGPIANVIGK